MFSITVKMQSFLSFEISLVIAITVKYLLSLMTKANLDRAVFVVLDRLRVNSDRSMKIGSRTEKKLSIDFRDQRHVQVFAGQW